MKSASPTEFRTSVRELVEFIHRTGDLGGAGGFRASGRMVEGTRGHQRLQKARGPGYRAEVPLDRIFERSGIRLRLSGRVDGLFEDATPPVVEEIKTVDGKWSGRPDPVHIAQVRVYAALLAQASGWTEVEHRVTYLDLETDLETTIRDVETNESLSGFLDETLQRWFSWLVPRVEWLQKRNSSLAKLAFPFHGYRAGQRELARAVYKIIRDKGRAFIEAPTGLGKTLATLYPAVKALPMMADGQLFYVTAKTPGRLAAEDATERLRSAGACLRSLSLTAKKKICFSEAPSGCDVRTCPYAIGYYDRIKPALRKLLAFDHLTRERIEEVARAHQVCPFELSLDASLWTDVIIGDYNYVFDPSARLQRHFAEGPPRHVVLVDESHNLVERSRDMHSAALSLDDLTITAAPRVKGAARVKKSLAALAVSLQRMLDSTAPAASAIPYREYHEGAMVLDEPPGDFVASLRHTAQRFEEFLAAQPPGVDVSRWFDSYFAITAFLRAVEACDETCRCILAPRQAHITVFCADPSARLREVLKGLRAAVFFSATLSPMDYFRDLLGGQDEDPVWAFPSPFRASQMELTVLDYDVTYKGRTGSLDRVAEAVARHIAAQPGNHLVFCPSMQYLGELEQRLLPQIDRPLFVQTALMDETQRTAFIDRFHPGESGIGLAVLGGIFSEGIDLPGDRLVGVTVIGVGLPRLSVERDILQVYFQNSRGEGFDYAYRFPGMQRVLQAVGRLIRSEQDRGVALLIDHRFKERRYRLLLPEWWNVSAV